MKRARDFKAKTTAGGAPTPTPPRSGGVGGAGGATASRPLTYLEFTISSVQVPKLGSAFDGYFYGSVYILACPSRPSLVGSTVNMRNEALMSIAPYFVYSTREARVEEQTNCVIVDKTASLCGLQRMKEQLGHSDLQHLIKQHMDRTGLADELRWVVLGLINDMHLTPTKELAKVLPECDLVRLPMVQVLYNYFVPNRQDVKQRKALDKLTHEQLHEIKTLLVNEPWTLVWPRYKKLKGLSEEAMHKAIASYTLQFRFPLHIQYAMAIYFKLIRNEENHTVFAKSSFNTMIPCMQIDKRQELEKQVYDYLYENALKLHVSKEDGQEYLCTKGNWYDAFAAVKALRGVRERFLAEDVSNGPAGRSSLALRGLLVPQIPPRLTARQTEIAMHIQRHWLTVVEGLPGTGKTALITWCVSHYKHVMLCSFVGMMVKSLQKRNGKRKEVAHTIHYLLAMAKHGGEAAALWLSKFQVLVLDEFSNVSMPLFRKLLDVLPNLIKVVLVGDHRQLKPIEAGDPMGDILSVYGSHMLHDNLRVVPGLAALQMAPALISQGRAREVTYSPQGPIGFINRDMSELRAIFAKHSKEVNILMNMHLVLLVNAGNDGRRHMNKECEALWQQLGVLKRPRNGGIRIRGGVDLYVGCKITFLKNYNTPLEYTDERGKQQRSDPIANGELAIVKNIYSCNNGYVMRIVDSEDPADEPESKTVWIHEVTGVHPMHVDHGYATTTFKTQGEAPTRPPVRAGGFEETGGGNRPRAYARGRFPLWFFHRLNILQNARAERGRFGLHPPQAASFPTSSFGTFPAPMNAGLVPMPMWPSVAENSACGSPAIPTTFSASVLKLTLSARRFFACCSQKRSWTIRLLFRTSRRPFCPWKSFRCWTRECRACGRLQSV